MNGVSTSRQAGERSAARLAMHCMMRPPPGATPAHKVRMSPPQAERITNSSSRGSIGRSTMTTGAAAGAAPPAAGAAAAGAVSLLAGSLFGSAEASIAFTALWQPDDRLDMFLARHCNAASPPGCTLEQCAMKSERQADLTASFCASVGCAKEGV